MSIEEQIAAIQDELPIEYPRQLYVRKGRDYVESYDPVSGVKLTHTGVEIEGGHSTYYSHSFDEFDRIYITEDEPVLLEDDKS